MAESKSTKAAKSDKQADAGAEVGSVEHLGERPYADEPTEQPKDDRDAAELAGTAEHLGDSPYAGSLTDG
jgi:hypothetical protein